MTDFKNYKPYSDAVIKEHQYLLQTVGFNAFPDFYTEEQCEHFKRQLQVAVDNYKPTPGSDRSEKDRYHLHDLLCTDIHFSKAFEDPRLQQVVEAILGKNWILYAYTTSSLPPGGQNYGSRVHVDCPRFIVNYPTNVGLLWALDDFTLENGGTKLLAGSHNSPETPTEEFFERHATKITCKKGTLLVFNARVFHRAGVNNSKNWRHSLTMNVCRPFMKQRMDWVRFIPTKITDQLNEQARRIIGFDTRLPSSLEEFFVPEDKRLYKSNQE